MTRFSVLLPTRNGGTYLENCIKGVLSQQGDFELVISDNANTDATQDVISRWKGDPRVRSTRLERAVSVTENWNQTLALARGQYLVMLGDDDYLLPGYFKRMDDILSRHHDPGCVIHNGYSYIAPGSIGDDSRGFYRENHFQFDSAFREESILSMQLRREIVSDMFKFRVRIPLNMQTTIVRRDMQNRVPGGLYQAPFPDHLALCALLLNGDDWVYSPERLVVVGVSPKSFGHYVYNNHQKSGLSYLGITSDFPGRLPGNELLNGMHIWLNMLIQLFPDHLARVNIDRPGYVRRQIYSWLLQYRLGQLSVPEIMKNLSLLTMADWAALPLTLADVESWRRFARFIKSGSKSTAEQQWDELKPLNRINNIAEFSDWLLARDRTLSV